MSAMTLSETRALLQALYLECYLNTTLALVQHESVDNAGSPGFSAKDPTGKVLFTADINTQRISPCVLLQCFGDNPFKFNSGSLSGMLDVLKPLIGDQLYHLPHAEEFSTITLNVPDWFADREFTDWLNHPEQNCFTYHRHGNTIGEYSDIMVLVDGTDGDASDMPERYWRQVVQAAHAYRARGVRLTNLAK